MEHRSIEAIVRGLNEAHVRYLIVGGLAVVAHGYVRFTADLDLLLDLNEANLRRAVQALAGLDYRPRAPVALDEFVDTGRRAQWVRDKGLTVFSLFSPSHQATEIDLFVEAPFDFDKAYAAAVALNVAPEVTATFVSFDDLVGLKRTAGRPQDIDDIQHLNLLRREQTDE